MQIVDAKYEAKYEGEDMRPQQSVIKKRVIPFHQ